MFKFSYKAINAVGQTISGIEIAEDPDNLKLILKQKGLNCYNYRALSRTKTVRLKKLNTKNLIMFSNQFAQMLLAGMALGLSLQMLYERTENNNKHLKSVYAFLFESVQKGMSLSESMEAMGPTFPQLYISMVKSGQMSGKLDITLQDLALHYEKAAKQQKLVKSAMSYPIILLVITSLVVIVLTTMVLPKMVSTLPSTSKIPVPTKILIAFKDFVVKRWYLVLIIIAIIVGVIRFLKKIDKFRLFIGKMMVTLPKFGRLNKMRITASFASSLSTLYTVGVPILDGIKMSGEIIPNAYVRQQIFNAIIEIRKGKSISETFADLDCFDQLLTTMIYVGEQSGALGEILKKTSDYFDEESTNAIKALTGMIQPAMLCIVAVIVGFVLVGVLLPMFEQYKIAG